MSTVFIVNDKHFTIPDNMIPKSSYFDMIMQHATDNHVKLNHIQEEAMRIMYDYLVNKIDPSCESIDVLDYFDIDFSSSKTFSMIITIFKRNILIHQDMKHIQ